MPDISEDEELYLRTANKKGRKEYLANLRYKLLDAERHLCSYSPSGTVQDLTANQKVLVEAIRTQVEVIERILIAFGVSLDTYRFRGPDA